MLRSFREIYDKLDVLDSLGNVNRSVSNVFDDSRNVVPNSIFIAIDGVENDGHKYISNAVGKGACVVICEEIPKDINESISYVKVRSSKVSLGVILGWYYNYPSEKLKIIGVIGTNGKTTIATMLFNLMRKAGFKVGLISTVENKINDEIIKSTHTTPGLKEMNELLMRMVEENCDFVFVEVSSHAIHQERIAGIKFYGGIFTNITHDHLDYHGTFLEYLKAKKRFFDDLPKDSFALVNVDDKNGNVMVQNSKAKVYKYGLKVLTDYHAKILSNSILGLHLRINDTEIFTKLIGEFNAYNTLAVFAVGDLLGLDNDENLRLVSSLNPPTGRFEYVSKNGVTAIVDYAHTPDALENVLKTLNEILPQGNKIVSVLGCGGDRDKLKRPKMGYISANMSSQAIFTSDNPRSENPIDIIGDMEAGVAEQDFDKFISVVDRRQAINLAVKLSNKGDLILIAGKGHEDYQEINGVKSHFNDKEVVWNILNALN